MAALRRPALTQSCTETIKPGGGSRMSSDALFSLSSTIVLPGWLLLVVAPRWPWTPRRVFPGGGNESPALAR